MFTFFLLHTKLHSIPDPLQYQHITHVLLYMTKSLRTHENGTSCSLLQVRSSLPIYGGDCSECTWIFIVGVSKYANKISYVPIIKNTIHPSYGTRAHSRALASQNFCFQIVLFWTFSFWSWHWKSLAASPCKPSSHLNLGLTPGWLPMKSAFRAFFGMQLKGSSIHVQPTVVSRI